MVLNVGQAIGRYEIVSRLDSGGGMGEVYKAKDTRLPRTVAIKVLGLHLAGQEDLRQRFEREAQAISSLNHPHICVLHDVGQHDGVDYLVMEYLEGQTLAAKLAKGPLPLALALEYAIQVAGALDRAHRQAVTHRDLKPANIILTKSGAKLLDFGLAKLRTAPLDRAGNVGVSATRPTTTTTIEGTVLGTLPYMAPEQLEARDVDARADLFSFGCLLYEMVTGKRAFDGTAAASVMAAILEREPPSIRTFDRSLPPLLDHIVQRCLAKDPDERWQTAADLKLDLMWLQRYERDGGQDAARESAPRTRGFSATPTGRVAALAGAAVLAAWAGWHYDVLGLRAQSIRTVAVMPFQNQGTDPGAGYLADTLTQRVINGLSELPSLVITPWAAVTRYKGTDFDLDKIRREMRVDAIVTGRLSQLGDEIAIGVELIDLNATRHLCCDEFRVGRDALPTLPDNIADEITQSLRLTLDDTERAEFEAARLYLKGRYYLEKREGDDLQRAVASFNDALARKPGERTSARVYAALANAYSLQSYYGGLPPTEAFAQAKANAEKALALDETLAEAHTALGLVERDYDHDWASAEREFKRALELDPGYATAHQWYAEYLTAVGRFDDALAEIKLAQRLAPSSLIVNATLGWVLYCAGRTTDAIDQIRRTLEMDSEFPVAHWFLGLAQLRRGANVEALAALDTSIRLAPQNTHVQADRAHALAVSGRRHDASTVLTALKLKEAGGSYVSPYSFAVIHAGLGNIDQAFSALETAYQEHPWDLFKLKVDPMLDRLRSDPRFAAMVQRLHFPEGP
jgi:serine/threonine-protein kinase